MIKGPLPLISRASGSPACRALIGKCESPLAWPLAPRQALPSLGASADTSAWQQGWHDPHPTQVAGPLWRVRQEAAWKTHPICH